MKNRHKSISRREALKRMGLMAVGVVATSVCMSPLLTACTNSDPKKKRIILYFTGTGNSLHVARELTETDEQTLSIPQMVKQNRYDFEADEIGIVYPIYGHMPPNTVRRFIERVHLKADYRFAVLTYGNTKSSAVEIWNEMTENVGIPFHYIATINMVDNWLPGYDMAEQMRRDKHVDENLRRIVADLEQRKHWHEPVSREERQWHTALLANTGLNPKVGYLKRSERCFVVTENCIGCGACTEVCPRGNYKFTSEGIKTTGDCDVCLACIHNCPQKAIRFKIADGDPDFTHGEKNPEVHYRNEHISLMDIKRANRQ